MLLLFNALLFPAHPHKLKVEGHVEDARSKGGDVIVGGARMSNHSGYFYQPSVIINGHDDMLFCKEETFGPIAPVIKWACLSMVN